MVGTEGFHVLILVCIFCLCDCKIYRNVAIGFEAQGNFTLGNGGNQYIEWKDCHGMDESTSVTNATLTSNGIIKLDFNFLVKIEYNDTVKLENQVLFTNSSLSPGVWRVIPCNGHVDSSCYIPDACDGLANSPCPLVMNGTCGCPIEKGLYTLESRYKFGTGIYYVRSTISNGQRLEGCIDLLFHNNYEI